MQMVERPQPSTDNASPKRLPIPEFAATSDPPSGRTAAVPQACSRSHSRAFWTAGSEAVPENLKTLQEPGPLRSAQATTWPRDHSMRTLPGREADEGDPDGVVFERARFLGGAAVAEEAFDFALGFGCGFGAALAVDLATVRVALPLGAPPSGAARACGLPKAVVMSSRIEASCGAIVSSLGRTPRGRTDGAMVGVGGADGGGKESAEPRSCSPKGPTADDWRLIVCGVRGDERSPPEGGERSCKARRPAGGAGGLEGYTSSSGRVVFVWPIRAPISMLPKERRTSSEEAAGAGSTAALEEVAVDEDALTVRCVFRAAIRVRRMSTACGSMGGAMGGASR